MNKETTDVSILDEIIELKFKTKEERTPENIERFLAELTETILDLVEDEREECGEGRNKYSPLEDGHTMRIERDDIPEDMIPFVILKKNTLFLDYKCPNCKQQHKYSIKNFDRLPFKDVTCPNCSQNILVRLNFDPNLKTFMEVNENGHD